MVAVVLGLSACSKESTEQQDNRSGNAIGFKSFIEKTTRATPTPSGALTQNFWVYGYYTAIGDQPSTTLIPDFMFNQKVNYTVNGFTYTPIKYWPETGDVNFYAFTPNTTANLTMTNPLTADAVGYPTFTYAVNDAIVSQEDVLVATAEDQDGMNGNVNFAFDHALTKVGFGARTAGDYAALGTTVKIMSISLSGIINKGDFSFDRYTNLADSTRWWTPTASSVANYALSLNSSGVTVPFYTNPLAYAAMNPSDQFLLMVPQNFTGTNANLRVVYQVSYADGTPTEQFTKDIPLDGTVAWTPKTMVLYALTISLRTVTFTATVNDWGLSDQLITISPTEDEE